MFKKQVKCSDCGFLGVHYKEGPVTTTYSDIQELDAQARLDPLEWIKGKNAIFGCLRGQEYLLAGVTSPSGGISISAIHKAVNEARRCRYYHPYNPGSTLRQHLDLQKETEQRRFLIIVTLLSAAVGAVIATLINIIW